MLKRIVFLLMISTFIAAAQCPSMSETQELMTLTSAYQSLTQAAAFYPIPPPGIPNPVPLPPAYLAISQAEGLVIQAEDSLSNPSAALLFLKQAGAAINAALKTGPPQPVSTPLGMASNLIAATEIGLQVTGSQGAAVKDSSLAISLLNQVNSSAPNGIANFVFRAVNDLTQVEQNGNAPSQVLMQSLTDAQNQIESALGAPNLASSDKTSLQKAGTYVGLAINAVQTQ